MEIFLQNARLSFANGLFHPSAFEDGQIKKYGANFLIDKETKVFVVVSGPAGADGKPTYTRKSSSASAVMLAAAAEEWKDKAKDMLASIEASRKAHRSGDKRVNSKSGEVYDGYAGLTYFAAKNKIQPSLFDLDGETRVTEESGRLYSGARVNVGLTLKAMSDAKRKGVHATLRGVQFSRDDEPLSGGAPVQVGYFAPISDGADAPNLE